MGNLKSEVKALKGYLKHAKLETVKKDLEHARLSHHCHGRHDKHIKGLFEGKPNNQMMD